MGVENGRLIREADGVKEMKDENLKISDDEKIIQDRRLNKNIIKQAQNKFVLKKLTPKLDWKDISYEKYRTYLFVIDGKTTTITIHNPVKINISKSGGHRILDSKNVSHYIPYKWIHLNWETKNDTAFRF